MDELDDSADEVVRPWYGVRLGILLVAIGAFLLLVGQKADLHPSRIQEWVELFGWGGPVVFVLLYIFSPLFLVPATLLTAAAGLLWHWPQAMLYVSLGCNIGANLGFLAGRIWGSERLERHAGPKIKAVQAKLTGRGFLSMVFVRVVPVAPFHVVNIGAGMAGVKWRDFFWATLLATLPGRFLALYAIDHAGVENDKAWMAAAALVVLMLVPTLVGLKKRRSKP